MEAGDFLPLFDQLSQPLSFGKLETWCSTSSPFGFPSSLAPAANPLMHHTYRKTAAVATNAITHGKNRTGG